jgi:ribosomal protein S12 methylthiotransferase accessory factor YcaO
MNPILAQYFNRLKSTAADKGLRYYIYERDDNKTLPYSVHFQFEDQVGNVRNSWGTGADKDEAFGKALMEMIERICFSNFSPFEYSNCFGLFKKSLSLQEISERFNLPLTLIHPSNTNGVAIHLTEKRAIHSAILELIERHTILYSFVRGIGPISKISNIISNSRESRFYIWRGPLKTFVVVGVLLDSKGFYFSSGCDFDLEGAVRKAKYELNSFLFLQNDFCENFEIVKDDIQSFNRYHRFSGDDSAIKFFESTKNRDIPELNKKLFFKTTIPLPKIFEGLVPLPCVRVIHPDVQQLFFDKWSHQYLNPRLFERHQKLPSFPHIIA